MDRSLKQHRERIALEQVVQVVTVQAQVFAELCRYAGSCSDGERVGLKDSFYASPNMRLFVTG